MAKRQLTPAKVRAIRKIYAETTITQAELATRYGVCTGQISAVIQGKAWAHIPPTDTSPTTGGTSTDRTRNRAIDDEQAREYAARFTANRSAEHRRTHKRLTLAALAREHGCAQGAMRHAIIRIIGQDAYNTYADRGYLTDTEKDEIVKARKAGTSVANIRRYYCTSDKTIRAILTAAGVE